MVRFYEYTICWSRTEKKLNNDVTKISWVELRTKLLSLRCFTALPKVVQAVQQPCRLEDKTTQNLLCLELILHRRGSVYPHLSYIAWNQYNNFGRKFSRVI